MIEGTKPLWGEESQVTLRTVGGRFPLGIKPLFLDGDKKYLVALTSLDLRVYSVQNKRPIASIPVDSKGAECLFNAGSSVWITKTSGECIIVNVAEGDVTTLDLGVCIKRILRLEGDSLTALTKSDSGYDLAFIDIRSKESNSVVSFGHIRQLAVSNKSNYLCVSKDSREILVVKVPNAQGDAVVTASVKRSRPISVLAVSDDGLLAVGSTSGVIDIYYEIFDKKDNPTIRTSKWHVDSVKALTFSLNGEYLLSGGKEKVLVFWQLETNNTQFLPRLAGDIIDITVDKNNEYYALNLSGEEMLVISAVDLVSRLQISGVKVKFNKLPGNPSHERRRWKKSGSKNVPVAGDYTCGYHINPATKHAYFPSDNARLQIYDLANNEQIGVLSVASTVPTGKVLSETLIEEAAITQVSFTHDGKWLATVDERPSNKLDDLLSKHDKEVNLKFWYFSENDSEWHLAMRISAPHGNNISVADIVAANEDYQGNGHAFITAAQDGGVRLWRPTKNSSSGGYTWSVRKIFVPSGKKSSAVSLAWSDDSSLIILAIETQLYAINGSTFDIHQVMPNILASKVRKTIIVGTYLVALTKSTLVVYDLINYTQIWSLKVPSPLHGGNLIDVNHDDKTIGVGVNFFTKKFEVQSAVLVFSLAELDISPVPVQIHHFPVPSAAVTWIPGTHSFSIVNTNACVSTLLDVAKPKAPILTQSESFEQELSQLNQRAAETQSIAVGIEGFTDKVLNIHSFDQAFDNELPLETVFERVMSIIQS